MSKVGDELIQSLREALAYARGEPNDCIPHHAEVEPIDVRAARRRLGLSQAGFASAFGVSVASLRKWEQGQRFPTGAARTLLRVIDREPEAVMRALHGRPPTGTEGDEAGEGRSAERDTPAGERRHGVRARRHPAGIRQRA